MRFSFKVIRIPHSLSSPGHSKWWRQSRNLAGCCWCKTCCQGTRQTMKCPWARYWTEAATLVVRKCAYLYPVTWKTVTNYVKRMLQKGLLLNLATWLNRFCPNTWSQKSLSWWIYSGNLPDDFAPYAGNWQHLVTVISLCQTCLHLRRPGLVYIELHVVNKSSLLTFVFPQATINGSIHPVEMQCHLF